MAKSFKKVIACLLAVLMVCCTMPFTAFAAPGDYEPDVQVQFGTIFDVNNEESPWVVHGSTEKEISYKTGDFYSADSTPIGIMGPMLNATGKVDAKTGVYSVSNLTLDASTLTNLAEYHEIEALEENYTYKKGDLITVTVRLDKVSTIFASQVAVKFSNNLIPAGIYSTGTKKSNAVTYIGTDAETAEGAKSSIGFNSPVEESSAISLYARANTLLGDSSAIHTDDDGVSYMSCEFAAQDGECDTKTINKLDEDEEVGTILTTNADGTFGNYYEDKAVLETFVFMLGEDISAENPIEFSIYDTDNTKVEAFGGAYYCANVDETNNEDYTTYAINKVKSETENPGSAKMTFFGTNVNKEAPEPEEHVHDYKFTKTVLPTCVEGGYDLLTCTNVDGKCDCLTIKENFTDPTGVHTFTTWTEVSPRVEPTPEKEGKTAVEESTCDVCKTATSQRGGDPIPFVCDHSKTHTEGYKAPDCTNKGYSGDTVCDICKVTTEYGHQTDALGHDPVSAENGVEPTASKDGKEADTICDRCKELITSGKVLPALGVKLAVNDTYLDYGTVEVEKTETQAGNVKYATPVTLKATPAEGAEFVGYEIGGKLVSKEATYTYTAYADLEITPVFTKTTDKITVVFYDMYSNIVEKFVDVTPEYFQSMMKIMLPKAPVYAGYNFVEWSLSDDEIKSLDKSTTVWATYEKAENEGFTVFSNQDVTIDCGANENGNLPFDARVTVSKEGAKAWAVDGTVVGYGESYTFFVGADITVTPVMEAVESKVAVAAIDCYKISADSHKVMFLATKTVPESAVLVDHGFIYGKNLVADDMVLENVGKNGSAQGAGLVKKSSLGTASIEQFGISYGITAMNANACARAYVSFVNADGEVETIYTDALTFNYNK